MRVTARSGDRESKEWPCAHVTVVATNSFLERGCPRVPKRGCPVIPTVSTFPGHGCPHVTKDGCPLIPATSSPLTTCGTAVPVSQPSPHPECAIPGCHSPPALRCGCPTSRDIVVPIPGYSLSPRVTAPAFQHTHCPRVPSTPVYQLSPQPSQGIAVPKCHPSPSPCPTGPVSAVHGPRRPLASSQSKIELSPPRPCPHSGEMKRGVPVTANLPAPVAVLGVSRPVPE